MPTSLVFRLGAPALVPVPMVMMSLLISLLISPHLSLPLAPSPLSVPMKPKASTRLLAAFSLPSKFIQIYSSTDTDFNSLLQTEGEETLQMAVTQVFREFGPVFVKIRRDAKQMPFAFCQYTVSTSICLSIFC